VSTQPYNRAFARVYNDEWTTFVKRVAPWLVRFYTSTPISKANRFILDICCGTGQLALGFLEAGYKVVGIDLSDGMLEYARKNTHHYLESGSVRFTQDNATEFVLDERFGLAVSTYDSINHLEDEQALSKCFQSVFSVLEDSGYFVFDLNTRAALANWNNISIVDNSELMMITHGIYDRHSNKAVTRISGFARAPNGFYERFEQIILNTVFELESVRSILLRMGWRQVHFASIYDLTRPIAEPEQVSKENQVFVVAQK